MDNFSIEAIKRLTPCDKCKYYVYRLLDPRNYSTFYVGKGCGNRVFQHSKTSSKLISKDEDEVSLKYQLIRDIQNSGLEIICMIHRWGLTEDEAFEVEAALIDCYPGLTNQRKGIGNDRGLITVDEFEKIAGKQEYVEPKEKYIIIKTTRDMIDSAGSLYEATRKAWRASLDNAKKYKYVLSVVYGEVKQVYEAEEWYQVDKRIAFHGKETSDPEMKALVGKMLPSAYSGKGMANPFLYKKSE